jgi:hypothetical protein
MKKFLFIQKFAPHFEVKYNSRKNWEKCHIQSFRNFAFDVKFFTPIFPELSSLVVDETI